MNKLDKPKFFTTPIWANIGTVLTILACFAFSSRISDFLLIIIIVGLILIFFIWNFIKYIRNWNKFYNNYSDFYQRFNELENRYNTRIEELKAKDSLIDEYEELVVDLKFFILTALTQNSNTEIKQLKNMQDFLYSSIEHLNKLKGGNFDGRNI